LPVPAVLHLPVESGSFELSTDGKNIILSPQNVTDQESSILDALEKVNEKYGNVLKRLGA
jgi:hypothetical protein